MSEPTENQHYVSQVLLRRFTDARYLQRFDIKYNTWKKVAPKHVFSRLGYTQCIAFGMVDNSLEQLFGKIERKLPKTLDALVSAAKQHGNSVLTSALYDNFCWYCACLWNISPFAKAKAPLIFVEQLDTDLKHGKTDLLRLRIFNLQERDIEAMQRAHSQGTKFILSGENYRQVLYRIQFNQRCKDDAEKFRYETKWKVYNSPVELPIADVAFFRFDTNNTTLSILPLSASLVLIGTVKAQPSNETIVGSDTLTQDEAEYILDAICLSALTALACKTRAHNIVALRKRAIQKKIQFPRIKDLDAVLSAGLQPFNGPLVLSPVTHDEYIKFSNSFLENHTIVRVKQRRFS
jgi:hypothetical protein